MTCLRCDSRTLFQPFLPYDVSLYSTAAAGGRGDWLVTLFVCLQNMGFAFCSTGGPMAACTLVRRDVGGGDY